MVQWRDRGYVADSDDEDLGLDSEESQVTEQDVGRVAALGEGVEEELAAQKEPVEEKERQQEQTLHATSTFDSQVNAEQELEEQEEENDAGMKQTDAMDIDMGIDSDSDIAMANYDSEDELPPFLDLNTVGTKPILADEEDEVHMPGETATSLEAIPNARRPRAPLLVSEDVDVFDIPSSPLSDARSNVSEVPIRRKTFVIPGITHHQATIPATRQSPSPRRDLAPQVPGLQSVELGIDNTSIAGRIFRRRAPIQLHPYMLEQEQYKQSLRARGLRPVAIASSPHTQDVESQEQQSQFQQSNEAEDSQMNDVPSSSPIQPTSPEDVESIARPEQPADYDSDELPDLSVLNNPAAFTAEKRGAKRRKVLQTYSRGSVKHTYPQMRVARAERTIARTESTGLDDVYALPPSPSSVRTPEVLPKPRKKLKKFVVPPGMTPRQLPTPDRSSQTLRAEARLRPLFPQLSSDSESDLDPPPILAHSLLASINTARQEAPQPMTISSDESSASDAQISKKVTRRLRGVLPASWLRLDQQTRPTGRHVSVEQSPAKTQQRGVAQRVRKPQQNTPNASTPGLTAVLEISDNSLSPSPDRAFTRDEPRRNAYDVLQRQQSRLADTQDIEEDDAIDFMLPTGTRNRKSGTSRKRQSRLTDAFEKVQGVARRSKGGGSGLRASGTRKSQPSMKRRAPHLSILDSRSLPDPGHQPDFLRVAIRQARLAPNNARHSPRHKIVQMQDRRNDADVKDILKDWRRGRVKPRQRIDGPPKQRQPRQPLSERSYNQQRLPSPVSVSSSTLKQLLGTSTPAREVSDLRQNFRQSRLTPDELSTLHEGRSAASESGRATTSVSRGRRASELSNRMPGQLEETHISRRPVINHRSALRSNLQTFNALSRAQQVPEQPENVLLDRYLEQDFSAFDQDVPEEPQQLPTPTAPAIKRQARKRTPQRLNLEEADIDFATTSLPSTPAPTNRTPQTQRPRTIDGLGPFGTYYTPDFDIKQLPIGTFFTSDTIVGSGDLTRALKITSREFESPSQKTTRFDSRGTVYRLGAWTEEVSDQIQQILSAAIEEDLGQDSQTAPTRFRNREKVVRAYVDYLSTSLFFLDAVDRPACLRSLWIHTQQLLESIGFLTSDTVSLATSLRVLTYLTVLIAQAYLLSSHYLVDASVRDEYGKLLRQVIPLASRILFKNGLTQIWALHTRTTTTNFIEQGITNGDTEIESIVVFRHTLLALNIAGLSFTDFINIGLAQNNLVTTSKVSVFDRTWHDIFAILPLLYIGESGLLVRSASAASALGVLEAPKLMLNNISQLYQHHLLDLTRPINPYIRATLARCFSLIRVWGWWKCDAVLSTMFDFFAHNGFALLRNEEGTDSPKFLRELNEHSLPRLEPGDRSFDIFLKALYVGLHHMRQQLPDKKIRNIAWRFIPNHGRQHERDSNLASRDLQALRNTHDLLSVLYAASPRGFRPNLDLLRNLVNFSNAHTEVCKLNVRAWSNLVRFQLAEDGESSDLGPFTAWYRHMITQLLSQYRQARLEAQAQFDRSTADGKQLSKSLVEATISKNQAQIGGIIVMALATLCDIVEHTPDRELVLTMLSQLSLSEVLDLYGTEDTRVNNVLIATLKVFETFYKRARQPLEAQHDVIMRQDSNEDSQDFGDFPDIDDMDDIMITTTTNDQNDGTDLTTPIQQVLSNVFGSESHIDDGLLSKLVDVWVKACELLVYQQKRAWTHFLDPQSSASWNQLRDTVSKRKYFAYFVTSIIETTPDVLQAHIQPIISAWLVSLVERESMLKYQNRLTTALLNACPGHALLANLPFVKDRTTCKYMITPAELNQRRSALLSSVFSNMRSSLDSSFTQSISNTQHLRHEYQDLLKQMMAAMRKNYQEIQQGSTTRGSYVEFVQRIIENLQQYTSDICPIDRFFTDSAAFPLPDSDPTYVVGRLKSYGLKAGDAGEQKKLAIFFQAVCERAAVDNQQSYLIEQLEKAVEGSREGGMSITLRGLLFRGIFPAYIEAAFATTCGWILAVPVLEALTHMLQDLYSCFSLSNSHSLEAVLSMVTVVLASLRTAFGRLIDDQELLEAPCFLATISLSYSVVKAAASLIDYIHRFHIADEAVDHVKFFQAYGMHAIRRHERDDENEEITLFDIDRATVQNNDTELSTIKSFCKQELSKTLTNSWSKTSDEYYVVRGSSTRQVMLEVGSIEEEGSGVVTAIKGYLEALGRMPSFAEQRRWRPLEVRSRQ